MNFESIFFSKNSINKELNKCYFRTYDMFPNGSVFKLQVKFFLLTYVLGAGYEEIPKLVENCEHYRHVEGGLS